MKPSMYLVPTEAPGRLFILPKPSGEWLREDVAHIHAMGVDTLVSLLEPAEEAELSLEDEGAVCAEAGIDFLRSPIPDRGLPAEAAFTMLTRAIVRRLQAGQGVGVHCRAGIGRSGWWSAARWRGSAIRPRRPSRGSARRGASRCPTRPSSGRSWSGWRRGSADGRGPQARVSRVTRGGAASTGAPSGE
jgi:hypothetical protein